MPILDSVCTASTRPCGVSGCEATSRYECPRCHVPYCTASCYGAHSQACVDAFANNTDVRLKNVKVSDWERRRFNGIVQRIREAGFYGGTYDDPLVEDRDEEEVFEFDERQEEQGDDGDVPELLEEFIDSLDHQEKTLVFSMIDKGMHERLNENDSKAKQDMKGHVLCFDRQKPSSSQIPRTKHATHGASDTECLQDVVDRLEELAHDMETQDLGYEEILNRLPLEMARDFETTLKDGRASRLLKLWRPWWVILPADDEDENDHGKGGTAELPTLPTLDHLLVPIEVPRGRASPFILNNVIDILAAYSMGLRLCNGDWHSDSSHIARTIWEFSSVLSEDRRFLSVEEVCVSSMCNLVQKGKSKEAAIEALHDVSAIISGRGQWVARALFECQQIFEATLREASHASKRHLRAQVRKIAYFVSWALAHDPSAFVVAARAVLSHVEVEKGRCEEVKIAGEAILLAKKRTRPRIEIIH